MRILNYTKFNEGLFSKFFSKKEFKTEYEKDLKQYDIKVFTKDDTEQSLNIIHDGRRVGEINLDSKAGSHPNWILTIYFYESEVQKDDKNYKKPEEIEGQKEQPFAKATKSFPGDSDDAIRAFWKWWSTNTKSGRLKNPQFKVKR